jgi:hypothetical protein
LSPPAFVSVVASGRTTGMVASFTSKMLDWTMSMLARRAVPLVAAVGVSPASVRATLVTEIEPRGVAGP